MSYRDDVQDIRFIQIDDGKREALENEAAGSV